VAGPQIEKEKIDHGKKPLLIEQVVPKIKKAQKWQPREEEVAAGTTRPTKDEPIFEDAPASEEKLIIAERSHDIVI